LINLPTYIVDPTRFYAEGAVVDWRILVRRLGVKDVDPQKLIPTIQLRWMLKADLGMPTEPFQVWVRRHSPQGIQKSLTITQFQLLFLFGYTVVTWSDGSMSQVSVDVQAPSGGVIGTFAGAPLVSNIQTIATLATGNSTVDLSAPVIDGLLVSPGVTITAVRGIETGALSQAAGWTPIELVGLPVKQTEWSGIGKHGEPQGMTGAFADARTAAVQRLTRGAPPIGWGALLAAGLPAPAWIPPNFPALVGEVNSDLLKMLRTIVAGFPPSQQAVQKINVPMPPPKNSSGQQMTTPSKDSQVAPLAMTFMAASSDPFLSLALGFGTAYAFSSDRVVAAGLQPFDYMITAHWEKGLDGHSAPLDYAAIVPSPGRVLPPPPPANIAAEFLGSLKPLACDGDWRCSTRVSWDRPPDMQLFRTASCAVMRAGITPPAATVALMETRPSGGLRPIALNNPGSADPEFWRIHAVDRELPIPANPGTRQVKYGAAVQDIYGQWTPWVTVEESMAQPDLDPVRLVSAKMPPTVPAGGSVCPASLEIEFFWDWSVRSPQLIRFAGRMYAAASHGAPPPSLLVPGGLDRALVGGGAFVDVTFAGDTPSASGVAIVGLNEGGDQVVGFGPAQGNEARRYRLTLSGLSLDFGSTGHIGMALWAQGQEAIAPQRMSAWSPSPLVISSSDPRPPVVPVDHVMLASLPDAAGESHARISWTPQPGATGYFIYESDETQILVASGLPEPTPDQTLDQRLKIIKDAFNGNPSRRQFTRLNSTAISGTGADVALPRGSTAIHVYVVLGRSAGQVESNWPSGPNAKDALIAVAAPRIMNPAAPMLEVQNYLDRTVTPAMYKARISISTRPGPRPKKVDLHRVRVDDAAKELDTMGPPIARIQASGGSWMVRNKLDANGLSYITQVTGVDAPSGSWRRVWYRAAAWTEQDLTRGGLPGRSPASTAAWVVVPPPDPPAITTFALGAGPAPPDVLIQWTSAAPLKKTPLGPHLMSVRANVAGAPPKTAPLLAVDSSLDKLPTAAPSVGSGAWIFGTTPELATYRALIRRGAITDAVQFAVRITDPLGRMGEQLISIAGGPVDPAPEITGMTLHKIAFPPPPKLVLEFASTVPLVAPLDGPYKIRITAFIKAPPFPPHPPMTVEMPVGSIPVVHPGPVPLGLYRLPGSGPKITYVVVTGVNVTRFAVRVTAPDGRFAEQTQIVT
jgi:hypothetical protein